LDENLSDAEATIASDQGELARCIGGQSFHQDVINFQAPHFASITIRDGLACAAKLPVNQEVAGQGAQGPSNGCAYWSLHFTYLPIYKIPQKAYKRYI